MLVYDVTNRETFNAVGMWMSEVEKYAVQGVSKILVGNKIDAEGERKVETAEGQALAKKYGIKFLETSAKNSLNVLDAFKMMSGEMLTRMTKKTPSAPSYSGSSVSSSSRMTASIFSRRV